MNHPLTTYLRRTFLELGDGFHFSLPPPPDIAADRYLTSSDPWEVLACVLARLQRGQMQAVDGLIGLMRRHQGAAVWNACARLLGAAGPRWLLEELVAAFAGRFHERGVQYYVSSALVDGCGLWAVPHLLKMHAVAVDDDARIHLELALSRLLEEEQGPISLGPARVVVEDDLPPPFSETSVQLDRDGFVEYVEGCLERLRAHLGDAASKAVAEGRLLDIERISRTMLARLGSDERSERLEWERMLFEAATGVACGVGFDDERVLLLPFAAVLEEFLDSGEARRYRVGERYFFGHKVPPEA